MQWGQKINFQRVGSRARAAAFQGPGSKGPGLAGLAVAIDPGKELEARSLELLAARKL
jgi:hypothetical protein